MLINTLIKRSVDETIIPIDKKAIITMLGDESENMDVTLDAIIDEQIVIAQSKVKANGAFIIKNIDELDTENGILTIDNIKLNVHRTVALQLKKAEKVALFICTIGDAVELQAKALMDEGHFLEGYTTDLIGSTAAEEVAERLHHQIKDEVAKDGLFVSNRFSPGYCNWNVEEQFKLFLLMGENGCGITLTDSALMHPIKSVSGLIGIGKTLKWKPYTCQQCSDKNCIFRGKKG